MLVLTRGKNETVMIGDDIEVTVVEVRRDGRVRLGFTVPRHIPVHRREVYDRIQKKKQDTP